MKLLATVVFSAIFSLVGLSVHAQTIQKSVKKNTVFLELLGNGGYYSLNYDRILKSEEKWKLAGRVGGSYYNSFDVFNEHSVSMPLELSYLRGHDRHFLEIEIGATPVYWTYDFDYGPGEEKFKVANFDVMVLPRIGYRYQKPEGGLFFKVGFTPFSNIKLYTNWPVYPVGHTYTFPLWGGVAMGYTF